MACSLWDRYPPPAPNLSGLAALAPTGYLPVLHPPQLECFDAYSRLKTGSIFGCNTFRPIDSMSGDKGLWVPGDCLTTQTTIATAYSPQSSDSDKPIGSVR